MGKKERGKLSNRMQLVAIEKVYPLIWPDYKVWQPDIVDSKLANVLDIGGIDTVLSHPDGHMIHIGQRFRKAGVEKRYHEFTVRENEWIRHNNAIKNEGLVPSVYVYGYATKQETDFTSLFVIRYRQWLVDVRSGRTRYPEYKDRGYGNIPGYENFYYVPWKQMPPCYIRFTYPQITEQATSVLSL